MDTRDLNYINSTRGKITKSDFEDYLRVQKSGAINMFGYNPDIQREDNYSKCYLWFIDKKQDIELSINKVTGLVDLPLVEREDGSIFDPVTNCEVDIYD